MPGEKVVLVGQSGCGKSTVLKLITGMLRPQAGTVSVLGVATESWDPEALRAHISVLKQEPYVFSGSVKDNILLGDPDADERGAGCSRWRSAKLDGVDQPAVLTAWNTDTGERGSLLSGGLRQRVEPGAAVFERTRRSS